MGERGEKGEGREEYMMREEGREEERRRGRGEGRREEWWKEETSGTRGTKR